MPLAFGLFSGSRQLIGADGSHRREHASVIFQIDFTALRLLRLYSFHPASPVPHLSNGKTQGGAILCSPLRTLPGESDAFPWHCQFGCSAVKATTMNGPNNRDSSMSVSLAPASR